MEQIIEKLSQIEDIESTPFRIWTMEERKQLLELYLLISKKESKIFQLIYNFNGSDCYEDIFRDYDIEYLKDKIDGVQDAIDMMNEHSEEEAEITIEIIRPQEKPVEIIQPQEKPAEIIQPSISTDIETEIENFIKLIESIKNYNSFYKYIEVNNTKYEINPELYDLLSTLKEFPDENIKKRLINLIDDKYNYNCNTNNKLLSRLFYSDSISYLLKIKINSIFIETRKKEMEFYESLPPEYAEIFKNNNYDNIFQLVKDKLVLQLEKLYEKQSEIYSKK